MSTSSGRSRFGLQDLRLPIRLAVGFALVLVLTSVVGAFALDRLAALRAAAQELAADQVPSTRLLGLMDAGSGQFRVAQLQEIVADQADAVQTEHQTMQDEAAGVDAAIAAYRPMLDGADETAMLEKLATDWGQYKDLSARIEELAQDNHDD